AVRVAHAAQTVASATGRSQEVIAQAVVIGASSVNNPWRRRGEAGRAGQRSSLRSRQTTYHPLWSLTDTARVGTERRPLPPTPAGCLTVMGNHCRNSSGFAAHARGVFGARRALDG